VIAFAQEQFQAHTAHIELSAVVRYPWHPAYGKQIEIHYREMRRGEDVFVCTVAADAGVVIPAWMFDAVQCVHMTAGAPRVSLEALKELQSILTELRVDPALETSDIVASEVFDAEVKTARCEVTAAPAVDCVCAEGNSMTSQSGGGRRTSRGTAASGRSRGREKRGTK